MTGCFRVTQKYTGPASRKKPCGDVSERDSESRQRPARRKRWPSTKQQNTHTHTHIHTHTHTSSNTLAQAQSSVRTGEPGLGLVRLAEKYRLRHRVRGVPRTLRRGLAKVAVGAYLHAARRPHPLDVAGALEAGGAVWPRQLVLEQRGRPGDPRGVLGVVGQNAERGSGGRM